MNNRKMDKLKKDIILLETFTMLSPEYNPFYGLTFEEIKIASDEKIMGYMLQLTIEIRKLIEDGYSEEEILTLIENIKLEQEKNINTKEEKYLKKDAKKTLKIMINNKGEW